MNPPWEEQAFDDLADAYVRASPDERVDIERAVVGSTGSSGRRRNGKGSHAAG